jgi:hypothetical protein
MYNISLLQTVVQDDLMAAIVKISVLWDMKQCNLIFEQRSSATSVNFYQTTLRHVP